MKKMILALALACCAGIIAYASLNNRKHTKQATEKQEKQKTDKHCKKSCAFG